MSNLPGFVVKMDLLADVATKSAAERSVLLAAIRWVNTEGELWPSMGNWARLAGVTERTLQRVLTRLIEGGIMERTRASAGGTGNTGRYRILAIAPNPDATSGFKPRSSCPQTPTRILPNPDATSGFQPLQPRQETPTATPPNPDTGSVEPRRGVTQSSNHPQVEQPTTGGVVMRSLSLELQSHPNSTPERVAWIERVAPTKDDPRAWAATCIRQGWAVPALSSAETAASNRESIHRRLALFDAMPEHERAAIVAAARRQFPNLVNRPETDTAMRGAIARVMEAPG